MFITLLLRLTFPVIAENISKAGPISDPEKTCIVIDKPFGHDLETSKELNKLLSNIFSEKQIYRIDHYLGKETVQNIMAFSFCQLYIETSLEQKLHNNTFRFL